MAKKMDKPLEGVIILKSTESGNETISSTGVGALLREYCEELPAVLLRREMEGPNPEITAGGSESSP